VASGLTTSSYTDLTAAAGTTYYYVVSAVTYGEGGNSTEVSCTPPPVVVVPDTGLQTTEAGGTAQFNVIFNVAVPGGGSTLTVTSNNTVSGGLVSSATTPTPTTSISMPVAAGFTGTIPITVTGVDDFVVTPNTAYTVSVSVSGYAGLVIPDVQLTNLERDTVGIVLSKNAVVTDTNGTQDTFSVQLNSMPSPGTSVLIALASSNTTEATVSPATMTFTPGNWNVPQVATVTGVGVNLTYITEYYSISLIAQSGSDPAYVAMTTPPTGSPVLVSGTNLHLETPPALPKVWGGSGGGCGLLGLEVALPIFVLGRLRSRRKASRADR
jgi:hypothetical protein